MKKILFQNVFKIYSYETLFSFNYNSYKEKKSNMQGLGRYILRNTYHHLLSSRGFLVQFLPSPCTAGKCSATPSTLRQNNFPS